MLKVFNRVIIVSKILKIRDTKIDSEFHVVLLILIWVLKSEATRNFESIIDKYRELSFFFCTIIYIMY